MKKLTKAIALAGVATSALTAATFAQAEVEVAASAGVANMYLWRGQDLGNGAAAVSGDLSISSGGAYGGVWASSGDTTNGQEYDLYVGYGGGEGDFSYDVSIWSYVYPGDDAVNGEGNTFGLTELIGTLGYGGASFSYYYPLSSNPDDYSYMTFGYGAGAYSATVGVSSDSVDDSGYVHVDLGYAFNDSLAFTVSKIVSDDSDAMDDDIKIAVSYSLPIEM